jgi:L-fuculose-phosphate aldolase
VITELWSKAYFDKRVTREIGKHLKAEERSLQETLAYACRIIAITGQEAGLACQISARS